MAKIHPNLFTALKSRRGCSALLRSPRLTTKANALFCARSGRPWMPQFMSVGALPSPNDGSMAPEAVTSPSAPGAMPGLPGSGTSSPQSGAPPTTLSSLMAKARELGKSGSPDPVPPDEPVLRSVTLAKNTNYFWSSGCACARLGGKAMGTRAVGCNSEPVAPEPAAPEAVAMESAAPQTP